jgi:hypothetical protein
MTEEECLEGLRCAAASVLGDDAANVKARWHERRRAAVELWGVPRKKERTVLSALASSTAWPEAQRLRGGSVTVLFTSSDRMPRGPQPTVVVRSRGTVGDDGACKVAAPDEEPAP